MTEKIYTHHSKGGNYRLIGNSRGASMMRGVDLVIYQNIDTGKIYHRKPKNFELAMVEKPASNEPTAAGANIPLHLRKLSGHMKDVATRMDYYGGFDGEMKAKAKELLGAARMAEEWADFIEFEQDNSD